jgi:hypothetical protein
MFSRQGQKGRYGAKTTVTKRRGGRADAYGCGLAAVSG